MGVTFINCFEVPEGREDAFLTLWRQVNEHMRRQPGYEQHRLHRSLSGDARYRFVNVAKWASVEDWQGAHDEEFRRLVADPRWSEFSSTPALFDVVDEATV